MRRTIVMGLSLWLFATTFASAGNQGRGAGGSINSQAAFRHELDTMTVRLGGVRPTSQQIIADSRVLSSGYRNLVPFVGRFGPTDYALNRVVARQSLEWLGRASVLYGRDPLVAQAFLSSYESIGGFYRDYGRFYQPGAFVAYAAATRLAQRMVLYGYDADRYERDYNRYALAYGTIAALNGALLTPWNAPHDLPDVDSPMTQPTVVIQQVQLPEIKVGELGPEEKAAWTEARDRFRTVAPRVYGARVLLNELSERLHRQQLALNAEDAANALKMQSFLEDAVELMKERQFDTAVEALVRAEYVRAKLKGVTGQ